MKNLLLNLCILLSLTLSTLAQSGPIVKWGAVDGATMYSVYTGPTDRGPFTFVSDTTLLQYTFPTNLPAGSVIRVQSGQTLNNSGTSGIVGVFSQISYTPLPSQVVTNIITITNTPVPVPIGGELIANGTFDSGLTSWTVQGNASIGSSAGQGQVMTFNSGNTVPNGVVLQTLRTTPGTKYVLSYRAGALGNPQEQRLLVTVTGNALLGSQTVTLTGNGIFSAYTWKDFTLTFEADTQTATLSIKDQSPNTQAVDCAVDTLSVKALQ